MERAKVVLVTHVGQGFGRAIALGYGQAGYDVVCADRDVDLAARTAAEVEGLGGQAIPLQVDPTSALDVAAAFGKVLEIFGTLGGVVHVVAHDSVTPFERLAEAELAELLEEVVKSSVLVLHATQRAAPDGWVVLVAPPPRPGRPHLAAVGGALARLAAAFPAPTLADPEADDGDDEPPTSGLRVNVVVPSRPAADPRHDLPLVHAVRLLGGHAAQGVHGSEVTVRLPPPPTVIEALLPEVRAALDDRVRQDDEALEGEDDEGDGEDGRADEPDAIVDDLLDDEALSAARTALRRWARDADDERYGGDRGEG